MALTNQSGKGAGRGASAPTTSSSFVSGPVDVQAKLHYSRAKIERLEEVLGSLDRSTDAVKWYSTKIDIAKQRQVLEGWKFHARMEWVKARVPDANPDEWKDVVVSWLEVNERLGRAISDYEVKFTHAVMAERCRLRDLEEGRTEPQFPLLRPPCRLPHGAVVDTETTETVDCSGSSRSRRTWLRRIPPGTYSGGACGAPLPRRVGGRKRSWLPRCFRGARDQEES